MPLTRNNSRKSNKKPSRTPSRTPSRKPSRTTRKIKTGKNKTGKTKTRKNKTDQKPFRSFKLPSRLISFKKNNVKSQHVPTLMVDKIMTDLEIKNKEGEFFPVSYYKVFVEEDIDVYYQKNGKQVLLCSFRKNVIPAKMCRTAFQNLSHYAQKWHSNRGAAAGVIDTLKVPKHVKKLTQRDKFRAYYYSKVDGKFHKDHISNLTQSNIIGFYDQPDRNLGKGAPPCRETKFNKDFPAKWKAIQPFLQKIGNLFKKLVPDNYQRQYDRASQTPEYQIKGTPFSTATINYNWQTALHRDKGDFVEGFGNLVILERGQYDGGYIGFPQFGVLINVRQGDFLAMDVHQWHTNTDIVLKSVDAARLSVVCYLRHKMLRCADE